MQQLILSKSPTNSSNSSLSALQATFNRQHRKIDQMRGEIERMTKNCDQALELYYSDLQPKEKQVGKLSIQFVLRLKALTQYRKALTKNERDQLKEFMAEELQIIFNILPYAEVSDDIKSLYKEIHGSEVEGDGEFQNALSSVKDLFDEHGMDIDLSSLNPNDSPQEIMEKLFKTMQEQIKEEPPLAPSKKKSKKELLKEQQEKELLLLQEKSLNNIYKRLAKVLHPDLEQDLEKRAAKEGLMKRLTVAYEKSDLVALLTLESEWLGGISESQMLDKNILKIYNSILKEQIESLKEEASMVSHHVRYIDIQRFIMDNQNPLGAIQEGLTICDLMVKEYATRMQDLSGKDSLRILRRHLHERALQSAFEAFLENH